MNQTLTYHLAAELLATLEAEGYSLGTGKLLQVQEVLHRLPKAADAEMLRLALCPLLARNPQEQARVYEMFDECRKRVEAVEDNISAAEAAGTVAAASAAEKSPQKRRWRLLIFSAPILLAIVIGTYYYFWGIPQPEVTIQDFIENLPSPDTNSRVQSVQPETSNQQPLFQPKPFPYDHDLSKYALIPPSPWQAWLFAHWWWLRWALLIPFTLLLVAIWLYLEQKRRKLIAEREHKDQPPYCWNIRIEGGDNILTGDGFAYALQVMRRRTGADTFALDLPRTIHATAERGGLPEFRFREHTQPVDYLLLIDRQSIQNHRARLFDALYHAFREQEIEMARFFYDSDMRVCFNEEYTHGVGLQELQQRYGSARLLVVGTGAQLVSPLSGKLAPWTSLFATWKQRALFTPKALADWGRLERRLPEIFTVLPATLQGLSFWVEELEDGQDAHFDEWRTRVKDASQLPIQPNANDPLPLLRLHYDTPMLQWIAACAIYPSLHWDLTLWLGRQLAAGSWQSAMAVDSTQPRIPDPQSSELVSVEGLLRLFRLPWFVEGEIPVTARAALLDWLEHEHPTLLLHFRTELALLLRHNPPPQDSSAFDDYQMNIALNEWLSTPDERRKKELEQEIARMLASGTEADFTVLKYLERPRSPLDFVVPDSWKKYVHPSGYAGLGWASGLSWLLPVWTIGFIGLLWPVSENDLLMWTAVIMALFISQSQKTLHQADETKSLTTPGSKLIPLRLNRFFYILLGLATVVLIGGIASVTLGDTSPNEEQYDCNGEMVKYDFTSTEQKKKVPGQTSEKETLALCLDTKEKNVLYLEWLIREAIGAGNIQKADSLSVERARIVLMPSNDINSDSFEVNAPPPPPPPPYFIPLVSTENAKPFLKKVYNEGNKNIAVALFNQGVSLYRSGNRDSACYFFYSAWYFDSTEVDMRRGTMWCEQSSSLASTDAISGSASTRKSGLEMVSVEGGTFIMGSTDGNDDESPVHPVTVSDFQIGKYEVTFEEYDQFCEKTGRKKPKNQGSSREKKPVVNVSWLDAVAYCNWLSQLNGFAPCYSIRGNNVTCNWTANGYRLPTEAEWEYAAKGGATGKNNLYSGSNDLEDVGWFTGNAGGKAQLVGQKTANELGIHDMSGNVWEWCWDWKGNYVAGAATDPKGPARGGVRIFRGGGWADNSFYCRPAVRYSGTPGHQSYSVGFRVARSAY